MHRGAVGRTRDLESRLGEQFSSAVGFSHQHFDMGDSYYVGVS